MPAGRPSGYSAEINKKARKYLDSFDGNGDVVPSIAGLSLHLKVSRSMIYRWRDDEDKTEFRDTLADLNARQENLLLNKGLTSEFNSNIVKLMLGNHGYSEKKEHSGSVAVVATPLDESL